MSINKISDAQLVIGTANNILDEVKTVQRMINDELFNGTLEIHNAGGGTIILSDDETKHFLTSHLQNLESRFREYQQKIAKI